MRISDRSSDVCSSDLLLPRPANRLHHGPDRARSIGLSLRRPARPWAGPCRDDRQPKCEGAGVAAARQAAFATAHNLVAARQRGLGGVERKSVGEGKSVTVSVGLGWQRIPKKKQKQK